ncbi:hypothetical protein BGX20_004741 [Mortierella sp. AD010]|nr:hypothetical protein BGX20_004741 [Mortierella sp. AD010]
MKRRHDDIHPPESSSSFSSSSAIPPYQGRALMPGRALTPGRAATPSNTATDQEESTNFWKKKGMDAFVEWLLDPINNDRLQHPKQVAGHKVADLHKEVAQYVNDQCGTDWKASQMKTKIKYAKDKYIKARDMTRKTGEGDTDDTTLRDRMMRPKIAVNQEETSDIEELGNSVDEDRRQALREERPDFKEEMEEGRARLARQKKDVDDEREKLKKDIDDERERFKKEIDEKREMFKKEIEARREELMKEREEFKKEKEEFKADVATFLKTRDSMMNVSVRKKDVQLSFVENEQV